MTTQAPFGSWKSPITTELIVTDSLSFQQIGLDGEDIYWIEARPGERGRNVIVRRTPDGRIEDVIPADFNARTRVHEYGGAAFTMQHGLLLYANFADQLLYRQSGSEAPEALTPPGLRYADGVIDERRKRLLCVREDHTQPGQEAVNTIVAVDLEGSDGGQVLASGYDFYATPRLSPDGTRLAWLAWNHPNMPWTTNELWVGEIGEDGAVVNPTRVAGGRDESIFQPTWSPDGQLYFVSDRSNWWNLYRLRENGSADGIEAVLPMEAEFGVPQWTFGATTYGFASADRIICSYTQDGIWYLADLDVNSGTLQPFDLPYSSIRNLQVASDFAVFMAAAPDLPSAVVRLNTASGRVEVLRRSTPVTVDDRYLASPRAIEFPTENGLTAHGIFYPPHNEEYAAPAGELPPLLVMSHGGPTGATSSAFSLSIQYWTSRGIAVLDVNYGGSTGYGRAYRQRLNDRWGIVDVDDCVNGAKYLVEQGEVDPNRLMIRGGSAGGYTTLAALAFRDTFKAGASHFGIGDLEALAKETHKFESRYLDGLIGAYPKERARYLERSPIHHVDGFDCPVIFFQGLEDAVVPPNQAESMVAALEQKGIPVAYVPFEGEQHGFRQAQNIQRSLEAELYFYSQIFGFELADEIEPVEIRNL